MRQQLGWTVQGVKRARKPSAEVLELVKTLIGEEAFERRDGSGFVVLARRWVVEQTLAWCGKQRRLSKDDEGLTSTEETWCYMTMVRLMLKRLASLY